MTLNKKYVFCLIFSLCIIAQSTYAQDNTEEKNNKMTLDECIEYAFKNNASMIDAKIDIELAKSTVGEVRAQGLPQVNGTFQITDNYKIPTSFIPADIVRSDDNPIPPDVEFVPVQFSTQYTGYAGLNMTQLIFDGTYFLGLKAADTYTELSKAAVGVSKADIALNVTKSYYGVLVIREQLKLLDKNIERVGQLLTETKELYANGFVEELDVDKLSVTYNNLESEKQRLERLEGNSLSFLKFQMGMPVVEELQLEDELVAIQMDNQLFEESFDYKQRPEYGVYEVQRELDLLNVKQYKVGYYPTVNFNANYGFGAGSNKFNLLRFSNDNWFGQGSLGISVNIPVFDGLRKKYQIEQAKLSLQKTENNITNLKKTIDWERQTALNTLSNSISTLETQSKNIELAKKIAGKTKIKYKEGVGSSLEVIQAETDLLDAQNSYFSALYDALIAKADYDKAVGKILGE